MMIVDEAKRSPRSGRFLVACLLLGSAVAGPVAAPPPRTGGLEIELVQEEPVYLKQHFKFKVWFINHGQGTVTIEPDALAPERFTVIDDRGRTPRRLQDPPPVLTEAVSLKGRSRYEAVVDLTAWYPRITARRRSWKIRWTQARRTEGPLEVKVIRSYDPLRDRTAEVTTELGTMTWVLLREYAPNHVKHFVDLAREGFYDGLSFFRAIPGIQVEGGDPKEDGTGAWKRLMMGEIARDLEVTQGMVGASRKATSMTSDSMFFITLRPLSFMKGKHTFFARVSDGWDVLGKIARRESTGNTGLGEPYLLQPPVRIERIRIRR
ncbi:MAG: peptidylprolyl isomerase [Acidobacteriota bacterium]